MEICLKKIVLQLNHLQFSTLRHCKICFDCLKCFYSREFYQHNNEKDIGLKTALGLKPKNRQCTETDLTIKGNLFYFI